MRQAASDDDLRAAPIGAWRAGQSWIWFCPRAELCGFAVWGRPQAAEMERLGRLLEVELGPPIPPHVSLVDASRLEGVDARAFAMLAAYVGGHFAALSRQVTKLAIVRPAGLTGATVSGFFQVLDRPYPVEVFGDAAAALTWLGATDGGLLAELDALAAAASGLPPLLVELRRLLDRRLADLGPARAARALGLSVRSFQRRLAEAGTTFQAERGAAQVRAAQRLLLDSDASLTEVALEVGCASPQHFSALFRRLTGEAPSAWRTRQRAARTSSRSPG
ncbi:MAG TPA: helix-turn-helix transcriptional regulator [Kofleriaceae bacterium]|nr:helix-turn-helix transcriptional regulator [Kofleriaceae bacterium]